jgi:hypothetical protein
MPQEQDVVSSDVVIVQDEAGIYVKSPTPVDANKPGFPVTVQVQACCHGHQPGMQSVLGAINREGRGAVMRFKHLGTLPVVSDADGMQARQLQDSLTHSSSSEKPFIVEAQFECEQIPDRNNPSGPTRFKPLLAAPEEYYEPADKQQEEGFTQEEVQSAAKRTLTFIIGEALGVDWEPALKQRLVECVKERAAGEPKVLPASCCWSSSPTSCITMFAASSCSGVTNCPGMGCGRDDASPSPPSWLLRPPPVTTVSLYPTSLSHRRSRRHALASAVAVV